MGPETVAIVMAVAAVASTAVTTYAAIQSANQQADMADAIRKQREAEAKNIEETSAFEERQHRRRMALLAGQQTALFGASGVDIGIGTPLMAQVDLAKQAELEALNIRRGGRLMADERRFEGGLQRYRASSLRGSVPLTAIGGGLQAGVSGYSAYRRSGGTVLTDWLNRG